MAYSTILAGLVTLAAVGSKAVRLDDGSEAPTISITVALQNMERMEDSLAEFGLTLSKLHGFVMDYNRMYAYADCASAMREDESPQCKRNFVELEQCIQQRAESIINQVEYTFNEAFRQPWEKKFEGVRKVLENPDSHRRKAVQRAVQILDTNTSAGKWYTNIFYNGLKHFETLESTIVQIDNENNSKRISPGILNQCMVTIFPSYQH